MKTSTPKKGDQEHLIKKIYELGFEVGYNNHSEIGWVMREFTQLIEEARKLGIESPESYYSDGKTKGKTRRDKGVGVSAEQKTVQAARGRQVDMKSDIDDVTEEVEADRFLKKPSLSDIPHLVGKISMVEIPKFLQGLKLLKRK